MEKEKMYSYKEMIDRLRKMSSAERIDTLKSLPPFYLRGLTEYANAVKSEIECGNGVSTKPKPETLDGGLKDPYLDDNIADLVERILFKNKKISTYPVFTNPPKHGFNLSHPTDGTKIIDIDDIIIDPNNRSFDSVFLDPTSNYFETVPYNSDNIRKYFKGFAPNLDKLEPVRDDSSDPKTDSKAVLNEPDAIKKYLDDYFRNNERNKTR